MNLAAIVEAIVFAAHEPVSVSRLSSGLGVKEQDILDALEALDRMHAERGVHIQRVAGGLVMRSKPEYARFITDVLSRKVWASLSKGALETLAVIAYRQPVTRQDIAQVRGVNPESSLETLLEKGLVREAGRKRTLGRPKLYATTTEFLKRAGLESLKQLPPLEKP